jgi:hypothetical protein
MEIRGSEDWRVALSRIKIAKGGGNPDGFKIRPDQGDDLRRVFTRDIQAALKVGY